MTYKCFPEKLRGPAAQFIAAFTAVLLAISDGMQFAWSSPIVPILLSEDSPLETTKEEAHWLETILVVGLFCGLPFTILSVKKLGQKKSLILAAIVSLLVWIVIALATDIKQIIAARFFCGMSNNMVFVAAPMYIAEIADKDIRGFLSNLIYMMILTGNLIVYSITQFVPFYVPSVVAGVILLIEIVVFPFMPESPYYLLSKGETDEARKSLRRLRQRQDVEKELEDIRNAVERQNSESGKIRDLVVVNSNRKALSIMLILNFAQHFSGISVILMNLHTILEDINFGFISSSAAAVIYCGMMFLSALLASYTVDRFGRRVLLMVSTVLVGLCLLVLAIYFTFEENSADVLSFAWLPLAALFVYAIGFKLGLGTIPIIFTSELFPTKMKALGMTLADGSYGLGSILSLQVYHLLFYSCGIQYPFFIFATVAFLTAVVTVLYIPETRGKTLEEIQFILKGEEYVPRRDS